MEVFGQRVLRETIALTAICLLDLITTVYWIAAGMATEANPLLHPFLAEGFNAFIAAKILFFLPAVIFGEWYRRYRPELVASLFRWVIVLYLLIYFVGVARYALDFPLLLRAILPGG